MLFLLIFNFSAGQNCFTHSHGFTMREKLSVKHKQMEISNIFALDSKCDQEAQEMLTNPAFSKYMYKQTNKLSTQTYKTALHPTAQA